MSIALSFVKGAAIVAGGTGGIGEAICRRFAEAGAPIVLVYHGNQSKADTIKADIEAAGGQCDTFKVDLSDTAAVEELFASARQLHSHIAHVVYAAGPGFDFAKIGEIPPEQWKYVINADVNGAFNLIQCAVQQFRQQGGGNLHRGHYRGGRMCTKSRHYVGRTEGRNRNACARCRKRIR